MTWYLFSAKSLPEPMDIASGAASDYKVGYCDDISISVNIKSLIKDAPNPKT